jgi:hypothetical protein
MDDPKQARRLNTVLFRKPEMDPLITSKQTRDKYFPFQVRPFSTRHLPDKQCQRRRQEAQPRALQTVRALRLASFQAPVMVSGSHLCPAPILSK